MSPWPSCLNHCLQNRRLWFNPTFCFFFFPSRMRIIPFWRHYSSLFRNIFRPTCVMMLKMIRWDAILDFLTALRARPWLPPWGTESWPAGAPWVLGFSPEGGSRLCSEGELVMSSRKNGKRTLGTPDGTCGQPERGTTRWFSGTPFPRAHCARRASGSPGRDSSTGGSNRLTSGTSNCGRTILPREGKEKKQKTRIRKKSWPKFSSAGQNNLFQSLALEYIAF